MIDVYYPEIRVQPVKPRSRTNRAFLPGYLFVLVDPERVGFSDLNLDTLF
jgi:transcriptional antiterminator RfaH